MPHHFPQRLGVPLVFLLIFTGQGGLVVAVAFYADVGVRFAVWNSAVHHSATSSGEAPV